MTEEKMQYLRDMIPNVSEENIIEVFKEYDISFPDNVTFSNKINIVVGSNGSGKTRFLKGLKKLYQTQTDVQVVYGYFPSLSDTFVNDKEDSLPQYSLYESLDLSEASFEDFLNAIEHQGIEFITELLLARSVKQKERKDKIWDGLSKDFYSLTGKYIIKEKNQIWVENNENKRQSLEDALKLFSPGEIMLFYMSIFLAIQKNSRNTHRVIILDEPESHLHPRALRSFMAVLVENHKFDTVWIATHSLLLIPEYKFDNLIYMVNGKIVKKSSVLYQNLLLDMLGNETQKIEEFFLSLSQWQFCNFISECFTDPTVIDVVNPKDEQVQLFVKFLKYCKNKKSLRVLDYGGGSARLGLSIKMLEDKQTPHINYEIYDPKPKYAGNEFKTYTDFGKIKGKYNCVTLMNVLHEIKPDEWCDVFEKIHSILDDNSYLIFVEVGALTNGEMPNKNGYFVLGIEELNVLFKSNSLISEIKLKENQKSVCFAIPKSEISNISIWTIFDAIECLKKRSYEQIKNIRSYDLKEIRDNESRKYAFWVQQYINTVLFKKSLENDSETYGSIPTFRSEQNEHGYREKQIEQIEILLNSVEIAYSTNEIINSIRNALLLALERYRKGNEISERLRSAYWNDILWLEKSHKDKVVIAELLRAAMLMGDERCENRYYNNGYDKYILEL